MPKNKPASSVNSEEVKPDQPVSVSVLPFSKPIFKPHLLKPKFKPQSFSSGFNPALFKATQHKG